MYSEHEQRRVIFRTSASAKDFWSRERSSREYSKDGTVVPWLDERVLVAPWLDERVLLPYQRRSSPVRPSRHPFDFVACAQNPPFLSLKSGDTTKLKSPEAQELRLENAELRQENERLRAQCDAVMHLNAALAQSAAAHIQAFQDVMKLRPN